jgi:ribosome-associated toxin RatA of RatAB toxin-antitoxin module
MVHVRMTAKVPGRSAAEVYALLSDLSRYPDLVPTVHSVRVEEEGGRPVSSWEVDFQGGIMRWKEEDVFLPEESTMRFQQLQGDVDHFAGEWKVSDTDGGSFVEFNADFDLGVAGLSEVLDPIAINALQENIRAILLGLVGDAKFDE